MYKQEKRGKTVLFSGFLAAFLGVTGMPTGMVSHLNTSKSPVESVPACEEHAGVKAIISDSSLKESESEAPKECEREKKIEETLKAEVALPTENEAVQAALAAAKAEEELYQKRVAELEKLLQGHPLAKMAPEIAKQEPEIAALIVGIARKESQWGLRSPKKNGDCFNYWGFKGAGGRGTGMGYACFATREEAVEKIASRLEKLVVKRGSSAPSALVTPWKCGNSCATHSPESVRKWVSDVNQYYTKVLAMK